MKKFMFLIAAMAYFSILTAQAPVSATQDFNNRYNNVQVSWVLENTSWVATFQVNNELHQSFYNTDGTWIGTETPSSLTGMSSGAQDFINTRFIGQGSPYTYVKSTKRTEGENTLDVGYLTTADNKTLKVFFDASGKLIKREIIQ